MAIKTCPVPAGGAAGRQQRSVPEPAVVLTVAYVFPSRDFSGVRFLALLTTNGARVFGVGWSPNEGHPAPSFLGLAVEMEAGGHPANISVEASYALGRCQWYPLDDVRPFS